MPIRSSATFCGLVLLLAVSATRTHTQEPPRVSPFRAGVDLVEVDVAALDNARRPVRGLTAADFTVLEDGKPRPIAAFTAVELPGRAADTGGAAWMRDVAPDVTSNDALPEEGRLLVIFFDRTVPLGNGALVARDIARAAIRDLGAGDLAAIVYSKPGGSPQDFTNDRQRLLSVIDGTYPGTESSLDVQESLADQSAQQAVDLGLDSREETSGECYCGTCTHYAIARVADAVRDIGRRRKTLLFIGSNLSTDTISPLCGAHVQKALEVMFDAVDHASLTVDALDPSGLETGALTASSQVRASGSLTASLRRSRGMMVAQGNIAVLPDRTGGRVIKNTNTPAAHVPDLLAESSSYYLLGFEPAAPRDGKTHRIQVKVNRRGVKVTTRRGYVAGAATPPPPTSEARARQVVDGVIAARHGVTLAASAAALLTPGTAEPLLAVTIAAEHDPAPAVSRPERVHVVTHVRSMNGEDVRTLTQTLEVTPARGEEAAPRYEIVQRLPVAPGRYEVRIGLDDESRSQSGSVYTFVDIPKPDTARLFLSDVVVEGEGTDKPLAAAGLDDVLPFVPTARREFLRSAVLSAFLQVRQNANAAAPVSISARVVDADDRLRFEQHGTLEASSFGSGGLGDCTVEIPLSDFTSGEYLLTIEARAGTATAKRQVRFAVKG